MPDPLLREPMSARARLPQHTHRTSFLAVPVFYVASAWIIKDKRRRATATIVLLFALDIGYALYMQLHGVQHGLDRTPTNPIPIQ